MALIGALLLSVILLLIGGMIFQLVRSSMLTQLDVQLVEEMSLISEIHQAQGNDGVLAVLKEYENTAIATDRFAGGYAKNGTRIAGNLDIDPGTIAEMRVDPYVGKSLERAVYLHSEVIGEFTIVIGRGTESIRGTLRNLLEILSLTGIIALLGILVAGWILSRRSFIQLSQIAETLQQVAEGHHNARVPHDGGNSQIDRISGLINVSLERLSALMESIENTTRALAHDLRSPLNRVFILVQQAKQTRSLEHLQEAEVALEELTQLFDTVLRIARIESSSTETFVTVVDLKTVVDDVAAVFQSALEESDHHLNLICQDKMNIHGDVQMLKLLLTNLLKNFIRHTPPGSHATISVELHREEGVILTMADDGPGIPEDQYDVVLEPFKQLDESRGSGGSGLGLALVRAISVRHQATLTLADNQPGLIVRIRFSAA